MQRARTVALDLPVECSNSRACAPLRPVRQRTPDVKAVRQSDNGGGTPELEDMSDLIGDIYDVTLDPTLWPGVLASIMTFVGGQAAGLLSKDAVSKAGAIHHHVGVDDRYVALYREQYWRYDPMAALAFQEAGHVISRVDYVSDEEYREGRFFKEWLQPQGWVDAANVVVEKSATSFAVLSVVRRAPAGPVDDDMRTRMRLIFPHVRRAVLIGQVIDLKTIEAAGFAGALDGLSAGMFLVDAAGGIVHANASGHAMLSARNVLYPANGRLVACMAPPDQALHETFAAARGGDVAVGTRGISIPLRGRDGEHYAAHVLPLTSGTRRRAGAKHSAVAAVFVHKAALATQSPPEAMAKAFGLTPSELRVLTTVVHIGGIAETAETLGVAESTIKTHLQRLFGKTGTSRQSDLVKLVAGFSNPLVG